MTNPLTRPMTAATSPARVANSSKFVRKTPNPEPLSQVPPREIRPQRAAEQRPGQGCLNAQCEVTMTIPILVEPSPSGFFATTAGPLDLSAEASSVAEALHALKE